MKNLLFLLVIFPLTCFADARIELDTSTCHAPTSDWGPDHEFFCFGSATRLSDGRYHAFYEGGFLTTRKNLNSSKIPDSNLNSQSTVLTTDCSVNPGIFRNSAGKEYATRDCRVYLDYRKWGFSVEFGRPERFRVDVVIELNGLEPTGRND